MSLDACAELVARADPARFAALLAAPRPARPALLPLYALNVEVARAPWVSAQPLICQMRLQWWRDAVAAPEPAAHPVAAALHSLRARLSAADLDAMIAARAWDIDSAPHQNAAEVLAYVAATSGNLMWLCGQALGCRAEGPLRALGAASGLAAYLRAVPDLAARGKKPLPQDADLPALARAALGGIGGRVGRGWPAMLPAASTRAQLLQVIKDPSCVAEGRLGQSDFARKSALLYTAFRRGRNLM